MEPTSPAAANGQKKKAADQNRTGDLHITNVTLYRLSHSSLLTFRQRHGFYHSGEPVSIVFF